MTVAVDPYPLVEPFDSGMLDVGDGNSVHWEASGNSRGKPAVVLHGGPGQGSAPNMRRGFDPDRYLVVLFDQRGCGSSTPHASDPATDMSVNTTGHLVADIERLREHLGIDRWLVCDPDPAVRLAAATAWAQWEDAVLSLEPAGQAGSFGDRPADDLVAMVRICAWYAVHGAWLDEGAVLRDAGKLAGIPGVLIHGRRDLSCPVSTAFELASAWPDARLLIDDETGHRGGAGIKRQWLLSATDEFASR